MRHEVSVLVPALFVGGCSLIYNPSNIDRPEVNDARIIDMGEVAVDVEIRADANPTAMTLTEAFPPTILEGSGATDSGSRSALVVLRGTQFVKDPASNLTVELVPGTAGAVALSSFEVSGNGDYIALAVNAPFAPCADGNSVPVKVTVTESDGAGGTAMASLDPAFSVTCLDELTVAPTSSAGLKPLYSKIDISGPINITPGVAGVLQLRSASSITVGNINVSGAGREPGPGGGRGGLSASASVAATGPSPGGPGANGNGGGGAGYASPGTMPTNGGTGGPMVGDVWISNLATNLSSGGGAGGATLTNFGAAGGGGGGTIELTAAGNLTVGTVTANGGNGAAGAGSVGPGGDGAGGTGGTVLLRSFAMATIGAVSVDKGAPGGSSSNAGASSLGRVRADLAAGTHPTNAQKGPIFADVPTRVTVQTPSITLRGTMGDSTATLRVFDKMDNVVANMTYTPVFGGGSPASATLMPTLKAGYNRICVWVAGGGDTVPESVNCQTIAFLPP